jgi:hypothetical protein
MAVRTAPFEQPTSTAIWRSERRGCSFGIDVADGGPGTDSAQEGQCETLISVP